jgi:magnesium transporter
MSVRAALEHIRTTGLGERIVYFYVVNAEGRLVGVVPTRRLLTADPDSPMRDIMISRIIAIPRDATVMEACEFFILHKFLAYPVVDDAKRLVGVVDMGLFTDEVFDMAERERSDTLFEALGFRIAQVKDASVVRVFRYRFPWLLATIASGTICALITSLFAVTLAESLVLAFFLTLVLGLGESVSIQSMSVTIQTLRSLQPSLPWYTRALVREVLLATLLGLACGTVVGAVVLVWRGDARAALVIGSGIFFSLVAACVIGLSVPAFLHKLRLDPKIAAGPISLALADIATLLSYFTMASLL